MILRKRLDSIVRSFSLEYLDKLEYPGKIGELRYLVFFCVLLSCTSQIIAQTYSWDDFIEEYTSNIEVAEQEDWLLYLEELKDLHEHPININTATIEQLLQLPFLNEEQIEQIHAYIYLHGAMQTLGELRLVEGLSNQTIQWMHLFVVAENAVNEEKTSLFSHLKNDFSSRLDIPLYYRKGYQTKNGYTGDALYHRIRYEVGNSQHFRASLRVEKDAGERYYDSYGGFAMLQDVGIIKKAIVGDYRIGFGEGLVMGGNSWISKNSPSQKVQNGLRAMTGMSETGFLRGAGVTLRAGKKVDVSLFASYNQQDATLNDDGEVKTITTSGYHRTVGERNKKNNVNTSLVGANINYLNSGFHVGATGYFQHFNRTLNPGDEAYRRIYPYGENFGVMGVNYGYSMYRLTLAGETSYSTEKGGIATIHRASWAINRKYTLSAIQRYYDKKYYSFHANAFTENSSVQNETGFMLHLSSEPWMGWQLKTYLDFFHNPWPRYQMTHSSSGQEAMLEVTHSMNRKNSLLARYQLKRKESGDAMEPHHRIKLQWNCTPDKQWKWQTTALMHSVLGSNGFGLQETVRYTIQKPRLNFAMMATYFNTKDYDSRVYLYEPTLYNSVSSGSFYGDGLHGALTGRWTNKRGSLMVECKYTVSKYFDRDEQGSGLQMIDSSWKNDISVQLRIKI